MSWNRFHEHKEGSRERGGLEEFAFIDIENFLNIGSNLFLQNIVLAENDTSLDLYSKSIAVNGSKTLHKTRKYIIPDAYTVTILYA